MVEGYRMRKLKLKMMDLVEAFELGSDMADYYLDVETGKVISLTDEIRDAANEVAEEAVGEDEEQPLSAEDTEKALSESDLPDWEKDAVRDALAVEAGFGTRYIEIPQVESRDSYQDMVEFIGTVNDRHLQELLSVAIEGRGAFRRFKDVLARNRDEQERWYESRNARLRQRIMDWLAEEGIEPVFEPEPPPPELPPLRPMLIEAVLCFVRGARRLPGVLRIALLGEITTDKPKPWVTQVLVTVSDDADIAPLAALGRKLRGKAQTRNMGADVFVADPNGRYIGRTCFWRDCGPGIRMSCQAQHCGRRHYLHDDLQNVKLPPDAIAAPPIELWPKIVTRIAVPDDLKAGLIEPVSNETSG